MLHEAKVRAALLLSNSMLHIALIVAIPTELCLQVLGIELYQLQLSLLLFDGVTR